MISLLDKEPITLKAAIYTVAFGGMHLSELEGLEWDYIDFKKKTIRIRQASQYLPGKGIYVKDLKNESSIRIISMPPLVMKILKKYKAWQDEQILECGDLWQDNNRLFTKWNGEPIFPGTISKCFKNFRKKNNLPKLTFHQIRHTNASLMIAQGVNVETVSKRLGHAQRSTTVNIYAHALQNSDKEAAIKLQNILSKKANSKSTKQA